MWVRTTSLMLEVSGSRRPRTTRFPNRTFVGTFMHNSFAETARVGAFFAETAEFSRSRNFQQNARRGHTELHP
jgi:hypothetical protein